MGDGALEHLEGHLVDDVAARGDLADDPLPRRTSMTTLERSPATGSRVNMTPADQALTICWTPTQMPWSAVAAAGSESGVVGQHGRAEHARPAAADVPEHLLGAADPQEGVVLPGEAGPGEVLGLPAGAHATGRPAARAPSSSA